MGFGYAATTAAAVTWFGPHQRGLVVGIGVRISCDMLARKTLLARLACCNDCS